MHLSCVLGAEVRGPSERHAGRLADVIIRLGDGGYPPVTGLVIDVGGSERFVAVSSVLDLDRDEVRLDVAPESLGPFQRRPGEVLLARDVARRHLIYVKSGRLIRANEIELSKVGGSWQVVSVDPSSKPTLRRLLPRSLRRRVRSGGTIDWNDIEPFVSHVPTARLRLPFRRLSRLHPAQLADLVEAASHEEGEEIIEAVGSDRELQADVFEELDPEHQVEFLGSRSDEEAAHLLSAMEPDDAVDLLVELDQERRLPILQRLPSATQAKLRTLLSYHPESAGGLMNPDFVTVPASSSVAEALSAVRDSTAPPEASGVVFVSDPDGKLAATVTVVSLLRANPAALVGSVSEPDPTVLPPDADIHEVVRKMTDYNLAVAPVVDHEGRLLGQITVDDVLELLLPTGWRRQYGMSAPE